jgi:hypothetical protein
MRYARRRRKSRTLDGSPFRQPIAAGILLTENPNRGRRHGLHATSRQHDTTVSVTAGALGKRRDYHPLTVATPIKRARIEPKSTSYTI